MNINRIFTEPTALNEAIDNLLTQLANYEAGTKEYAAVADQLTKLYKLKEIDIKLELQEVDLLNKQTNAAHDAHMKEEEFQLKVKDSNLKAEELLIKKEELEMKKSDADLKEKEFQLRADAAALDADLKEIELDAKKRESKLPFGLKSETVALIAANLIGIAIIVGYERFNVVTSKAVGFVSKIK